MKYISANNVKNSDHESSDFIYLNNCGAFIDTTKTIVTHRPNGRMDFQIIYVSRGAIELTLEGENTICPAGTVILYKPHQPQIYRSAEKGTTFYWIHFSGTEAEKLLHFFKETYHHVGTFPQFEEFCNDAVRTFAATSQGKLYCEGRLISLIALLSQKMDNDADTKPRDTIEPAIFDMHEHFTIARTNDEYASMCALSKAHFIRLFHKCTGVPPQKYRTEILIREAKQLLKRGISVGDVAELLGFEDRFYFSRLFKKYVGISPKEYME